jgi:hypothetical protein
MAEQALRQITTAFNTFREAHHPYADNYEAVLLAVRALVDRLRKG